MGAELYQYYSTQRPIGPGTYPKPQDNPPLKVVNYDVDNRIQVEGEVFQAWGEVIYAKPLTDRQQYDYELRPSSRNPDVLMKMERQAQAVGPWEEYHHIPEEKRVTEYDLARSQYRPREGVTPGRLNARHNTAQAVPVPREKTAKRKNTSQHGAR